MFIYGNKSIAEVVFEYACGAHSIEAFLVEKAHYHSDTMRGLPVVAYEELNDSDKQGSSILNAVGYVGMNKVRERIFRKLKRDGFKLPPFIAEPNGFCTNASIDEGSIILDGVSLQPRCKIGPNNLIWSNCVVGHGASIGGSNWIAAGAVIGGNSCVGDRCFFGLNSGMAHNVTLADETYLGAGVIISRCSEKGDVFVNENPNRIPIDSTRFMEFSELGYGER